MAIPSLPERQTAAIAPTPTRAIMGNIARPETPEDPMRRALAATWTPPNDPRARTPQGVWALNDMQRQSLYNSNQHIVAYVQRELAKRYAAAPWEIYDTRNDEAIGDQSLLDTFANPYETRHALLQRVAALLQKTGALWLVTVLDDASPTGLWTHAVMQGELKRDKMPYGPNRAMTEVVQWRLWETDHIAPAFSDTGEELFRLILVSSDTRPDMPHTAIMDIAKELELYWALIDGDLSAANLKALNAPLVWWGDGGGAMVDVPGTDGQRRLVPRDAPQAMATTTAQTGAAERHRASAAQAAAADYYGLLGAVDKDRTLLLSRAPLSVFGPQKPEVIEIGKPFEAETMKRMEMIAGAIARVLPVPADWVLGNIGDGKQSQLSGGSVRLEQSTEFRAGLEEEAATWNEILLRGFIWPLIDIEARAWVGLRSVFEPEERDLSDDVKWAAEHYDLDPQSVLDALELTDVVRIAERVDPPVVPAPQPEQLPPAPDRQQAARRRKRNMARLEKRLATIDTAASLTIANRCDAALQAIVAKIVAGQTKRLGSHQQQAAALAKSAPDRTMAMLSALSDAGERIVSATADDVAVIMEEILAELEVSVRSDLEGLESQVVEAIAQESGASEAEVRRALDQRLPREERHYGAALLALLLVRRRVLSVLSGDVLANGNPSGPLDESLRVSDLNVGGVQAVLAAAGGTAVTSTDPNAPIAVPDTESVGDTGLPPAGFSSSGGVGDALTAVGIRVEGLQWQWSPAHRQGRKTPFPLHKERDAVTYFSREDPRLEITDNRYTWLFDRFDRPKIHDYCRCSWHPVLVDEQDNVVEEDQ
jgi:hypothetical protein